MTRCWHLGATGNWALLAEGAATVVGADTLPEQTFVLPVLCASPH